jgi:hypothetical protein
MSIVVGEVIAVSGVKISVRVFEDSSLETIFFAGVKYRGVSLREHVTIQRGFIDIVCLVEGEYLDERKLDSQSENLSFLRKVDVRPIGYIFEGKFNEGVKYMPMILDKASLLSEPMVAKIYGADGESDFAIGSMMKEDVRISLPWKKIFNSHLGIFGNTGSGKSNTLAKLYTTLFDQKLDAIKEKSKFIIIDFNGEYTDDQIVPASAKTVTILDQKKSRDTLDIESSHFWDAETLGLLFQATSNTQQPFLKRVVNSRDKYKDDPNSLENFIRFVFRKTFSRPEAKPDSLDMCREIARLISDDALELHLRTIVFHTQNKYFRGGGGNGEFYNANGTSYETHISPLLNDLDLDDVDQFEELILRSYLQLCLDLLSGHAHHEHIQPVLNRAKSVLSGLKKVLNVVDDTPETNTVHVISLKKCRSDLKKILPLLIAKNAYNNHKEDVASPPDRTLHIIIDEAHNILSEQSSREHEVWKDYRLEIFEEIIKEGRKYGVYLTLASQRPADISPTIVSQIHNFFLHRLVNERDLQLMENTISTLDFSSRMLIPTLAKGCCVVTGTAFDLPMILKVDPLHAVHRPSSDDVDLDALWS